MCCCFRAATPSAPHAPSAAEHSQRSTCPCHATVTATRQLYSAAGHCYCCWPLLLSRPKFAAVTTSSTRECNDSIRLACLRGGEQQKTGASEGAMAAARAQQPNCAAAQARGGPARRSSARRFWRVARSAATAAGVRGSPGKEEGSAHGEIAVLLCLAFYG